MTYPYGPPAVAAEQTHRYLAIDLGASSGRAVLGTLVGATMHLDEIHRFRTPLIEERGHLYWDADAIWEEIRIALAAAIEREPLLRSVSIDSWAVDYQPLDSHGKPVRRPFAYRDARTHGRLAASLQRAGGNEVVYARTGIQLLDFNTLPQVVVDIDSEPDLVKRTSTRLLMADYFLFRLSGIRVIERSMASSTQLMDVATGEWATELIHAIGDSPSRWPMIVSSGSMLGPVLRTALPAGVKHVPHAIATCSHDTACAVSVVPADSDSDWAYISSGTWSLVGAELSEPITTEAARDAGFTNEAGIDRTIRFLKNRTGMWVLEECMREWNESGAGVTIAELVHEATQAPASLHTIDLNTSSFATRGDMVRKITAACEGQGTPVPESRGSLVRLVLDSLAACYARTLEELDTLTGRRTSVVHVVGGGAQNMLLNQLTADATGRRVVAGPAEATVLGNLLLQARTLGDLPEGVSIREAARRSTRLAEFTPNISECPPVFAASPF